MKITLAQTNQLIGDIEGNIKEIIEAYRTSLSKKTDIIIFPELSITGYQPLDMIENDTFIKKNIKAVKDFAAITKETAAVIGFIDFNYSKGKRHLNACAFIRNGKIEKVFYKNLLPTYDIFDEKRYFEEGREYEIINFKGKRLLITICEDIWADTELLPDKNLYKKNIIDKYQSDIIINISASPYYYGKIEKRKKILFEIAKNKKSTIIYVNNCGANDELVFDGSSMVIMPDGRIYQAPSFVKGLYDVDTDDLKTLEYREDFSIIELALKTGVRDYFYKSGFSKAVVGVSGGIDSAVVSYIMAKAIGNLKGILMPSKFTSNQSIEDAIKLMKNLSLDYEIIPITRIYDEYIKTLKLNEENIDITIQNIQSRIRGNILMSYSNKENALVIATGNKSEIAMGYSTLYGDTCGAIAPIGDLTKTNIYKLAEYINARGEIIPESIISKPPTAELKPGQKDEDDLPPYKILDTIIELYIEEQKEVSEIEKIIGNKKLVRSVIERIEKNEYKRKQMPLIIKLTKKSFGSGRKMPIVKSNNWYF